MMVGVYQIDDLLIGYSGNLLPPPAGLGGDHRAINEHNAFACHHETNVCSPYVRFRINILSELLHLLICLLESSQSELQSLFQPISCWTAALGHVGTPASASTDDLASSLKECAHVVW